MGYGPPVHGTVLGATPHEQGPWRSALRWAAAVALGAGLSGVAQLELTGAVGPLTTAGGAAVALALALGLDARRGARLGHGHLLPRASRAALVNAILFGASFALVVPGDPGRSAGEAAVGVFAASVLGFLATFALVTVLGNTLDHYGAHRAPADGASARGATETDAGLGP